MVVIPSNASLPLLRWPGGSDTRGLPVGPPCLVGGRYRTSTELARKRTCKGRSVPRTLQDPLSLPHLEDKFPQKGRKRAAVCKFGGKISRKITACRGPWSHDQQGAAVSWEACCLQGRGERMSQDHEKLKPFSLSLPLSPHSQLRKSLLVSLTLRELHTHKIPSSRLRQATVPLFWSLCLKHFY